MFRDPNSIFNIVISFVVAAILIGLGIYRHYDMISMTFGGFVLVAGLSLLARRNRRR